MYIWEIVQVGIRSLLLHKLRSLLSILGIIFGVVAVVSMLSIGEGAKQEAIRQIELLGTNNIILRALKLTEYQEAKAQEKLSCGLILKDVEKIRAGCPLAREVVPVREVRAAIAEETENITPQIIATTGEYAAVKKLLLRKGRFLCRQDIERRNKVCVLGWDVASNMGIAGHIGRKIKIEEDMFLVVGVLKRRHWSAAKNPVLSARDCNKNMFIPIGTDGSISGGFEDITRLNEILVQVNDSSRVLEASNIIRRIVDRLHYGVEDYQLVIPQELLHQAQETQRVFNIVLGCIAGISLLVGGIGIMNIMLATVSERTREIGIRRAVGANQIDIVLQFLSEAILLTMIGGIVGILIGIGTARIIAICAGWKTGVTWWAVIASIFMSVLVGTFFGFYPAYKASKMNPITALRYE